MSIPTPEQFLAQTEPDEDDEQEVGSPVDPLTSMATSLSIISSALATQASAGQADAEAERRYLDLDQAFADLEDKHQALYGLLSEVEKIVAPSTSKLANSVREAITRWRNPEVPAEDEPEAVHYANCEGNDLCQCAEIAAIENEVPEPFEPWPANDAPIEEWREYARHAAPGATVLDQMNRSQIRTLLGVPQTAE